MKIFHHNDADGYMSANIIYNSFDYETKKSITKDDFICMDYTKPFDMSIIKLGEPVYIVDYSIPPEKMKTLLFAYTKDVTWIDHHISAIDSYKAYPELLNSIKGVRFDGISASALCYLYVNDKIVNTGDHTKDYYQMMKNLEVAPLGISYINDWDVWNHFLNGSDKFMVALQAKLLKHSPMDSEWTDLGNRNEACTNLIKSGVVMDDFKLSWAETFRNRYGFCIKLDGHSVFCLNLGNANSTYFGDLIDKYDAVMTFCYNGELFNCSIYSNKIDVSLIAKKYGGGGHKGASGFTFKDFSFITDKICGGKDE